MFFFWIALGCVLGALANGFLGALAGAVLGGVAAFLLKKPVQPAGASVATPVPDVPSAFAHPPPGLAPDWKRRVEALEQQVAALQARLAQLETGDRPTATPPSEPMLEPAPLPAARSIPLAALLPVAAQAATPAPPSPPAPEEISPVSPDVKETPHPAWLDIDWPDAQADDLPPPAARRRQPTAPAATRELKDYIPAALQPLIFGGNTIVKLGVLILFLGLSFLLRYVAVQVTVPIELRYAGVALLGAGMLALGWRLRNRGAAHEGGRGYGLILQGGGIGVFYLTTLAAMKLHPLLPAAVGFGLMVLITAFSALLAVMQNAPWLAMVASAAGFATPVLVSTGSGNHIALFSYLAVLDLGIMAMAWFRAWRALNLIGFIGTFTLAAAWADQYYSAAVYPSTQAFLLLFLLMFTAIGVLFARRALALGDAPDATTPLGTRAAQALRQVGRVDSSLVFGVPLAAYGLQYQMVRGDPWWPALSALLMGLFYVGLGRLLWRGAQNRYALLAEAYVVVGVLFGTLSIPLALEGAWTGATWAVEAAGMYWLGTRQHRRYTRAFALALLGFAALRTLGSLGWDASPMAPLLTGSRLGVALLAAGALAVGLVHRRAEHREPGLPSPGWEAASLQASWWLTVGALAALPWMILMPTWASVAMGLMAVGCTLLAERARLQVLRGCARALQLAALAGFASTLRQAGDQAMLANGFEGLCAGVIIGLCLLGSAWYGQRDTWLHALHPAPEAPMPSWSRGASVWTFVGLGLMSATLLFVMPAQHASLWWPLMALPLLWAGLRAAHPALSALWLVLTAASGLVFLTLGPARWPEPSGLSEAPAVWSGLLGGLAWWTPLILTVCGVTAGAWLNDARRRLTGWVLPWAGESSTQIGIVAWSLFWWAHTLPPELSRQLQALHLTPWWPAALALWFCLSAVLMLGLARWRQWPLMGQAAALAMLGWFLAALLGPVTTGLPPVADLGWLAWPAVLVCLPLLLRRSEAWWPAPALHALHVTGFWLLSGLLVRQAQCTVDDWTTAGSAWQALGRVLMPLVLVAAVSARRWQTRWPLQAFASSYRLMGSLPLVILLVLWLAWSLGQSGFAAPLPYVPLLNPLELGQGLVLMSLALWLRSLPEQAPWSLPSTRGRLALLGGIGFVLLSVVVLRACHHWAGVPWSASEMFQSKLAQAALSVTWALLAVTLMLQGHRRVQRTLWLAGAALLGVVVAKLFLIELADRGGLYRIISFLAVGLLLLVVGYFAPVPPARASTPTAPDDDARAAP
ncbi:MAG: DUF2339 domain-containing protein [Rubrivivax sp.]|nr:MAG: DUF2339 domain-containing protein [Rubrivivax sp.]